MILRENSSKKSVVEKTDELAMYSKRTDVEKPIGNKEPPFPTELCNQYDAVGEGVAGTTNSVEIGITDYRPILMVQRRIFGCFYGTWKKIRKCRSFNLFKKLLDYCAPDAPVMTDIKFRCKISETPMSLNILCHILEQ